MNERHLLSTLKHPYTSVFQCILKSFFRSLVNMIHAFQDRENLYLVMELMPGGDLRYHISKKRRFSEEQTSNKNPKIQY